MALRDWFGSKTKAAEPGNVLPAVVASESAYENEEIVLSSAVEKAMRKAMTADSFIAFDQGGDEGGMFGTEFSIQATAGRLKGLYSKEPWIFTSAQKIAKTLASIPFKVYPVGGDKEIPNHPLKLLLDAGSLTDGAMGLRWGEGLDLMLGGNFFLILDETYKSVVGLAPVDQVNLIYSPDYTKVTAIEIFGQLDRTKKTIISMDYVVQVKLPNPNSPYFGMSPFAAASRPILLDRYKNEFEMAFYLRGGTSTGVVETSEELSKSRFQRLMRTFEQAFTGRANWWRTLFLPKGATWKSSSLTMKEMEHLDGLRENRKTILAVLGIPPSMVGLIEDVNRATSEQQERVFWNDTILPLAAFIASGWNNSFLVKTKFKGKVEVRPDFSGIEAIEGFLSMKAEKSKSMEPYFTIDEIRASVWGAEALPDGRGDKFVAEVKGVSAAPFALASGTPVAKAVIPDGYDVVELVFPKESYKLAQDAQRWAEGEGYASDNVVETSGAWRIGLRATDGYEMGETKDVVLKDNVTAICARPKEADGKSAVALRLKAVATGSQNRIEEKLGKSLAKAYDGYVADLLEDAENALKRKRPVRVALENRREDRLLAYAGRSRSIYDAAMDRGFSAALSLVKRLPSPTEKKGEARFTGLDETDQQAVDVLRERTEDGKRKVLATRMLDRFSGLDANRTEAVLQIIEDGEKEGLSYEEIARTIRDTYGERYRNQARTIVRTEILSAVSEGLNWNHEVLGEVFSEVEKEWMHQGDDGINEDARPEHVELDGTTVSGDGAWTYVDDKGVEVELRYPRDPRGPAGAIVNCRCTMVSVIPDSATSNADAILESE